jgi:hypothetical protein
MASLAWSGNDVRIASYTLITHAFLSWVDQLAACWTQRSTGDGEQLIIAHLLEAVASRRGSLKVCKHVTVG